jgi:hypothetical protein
MVSPLPSTYYRILQSNPATDDDFLSLAERYALAVESGGRRRPIPKSGDDRHMWSDASVYSTENEARATAQQYPNIGRFIGRLQVPTDHGKTIRIEQTGDIPEHYSIWAAPSVLRACVDSVVDV